MSIISFHPLQLANQQRNAYGLRYSDYTRYRKHCTNRTHRLRSSLKMTHGRGKDFKKLPPITPEIIKEGHLELLLLESERAWAFAQDLINQSIQPENKDHASTLRHSATGRFRRAVHWSTQLLSQCQALYASGRLSAENLLETTIYTVIINGRFLRYREEFDDAVIQLSVARYLLDQLASTATTSRDQALAVLFSDEIGPEIRYCAHELGRTKSYDIDGIVAELAPKFRNSIVENCDTIVEKLRAESGGSLKDGQQKKLRPLIWEDQPVPVRNPELVDVLIKVQEAENKLANQTSSDSTVKLSRDKQSKKSVAAYDAVLAALSDAEDVARKLAEIQQLSGGTSASASASGTRDIHFVHAYIVYQLLSHRIQRDLLLASVLLASQTQTPSNNTTTATTDKKKVIKPEQVDTRLYPAVVKLLETVVQSLEQMRTLSIVDDTPDLASAVEARLTFIKARRCLYLARCYTPLKKYAESLTLLKHATLHIRETNTTLSILSPESQSESESSTSLSFFTLTSTKVNSLESEIIEDSTSIKRDWFGYNGGSTTRNPKEYEKPMFFNIALNYVPLNMDQLLTRAGKEIPTIQATTTPTPAAVPATTSTTTTNEKKVTKEVPTAQSEKKSTQKVSNVEERRLEKQQPQDNSRSGISSLLGAWWGRS